MRAAVFHGPGDLRLTDRPTPEPGVREVVVRVRACGICGTDVHIHEGEAPAVPPVVLGHEFAGEVVSLGPGVTGLSTGDPVAVDPNITCGQCAHCRAGRPHLCRDLRALGVTLDGGFAEYCVVPEAQAHRLGRGLGFVEAALAEPLACCLHGIDLAGVRPGEPVVIFGAGSIGLLLLQLVKMSGASWIGVSETDGVKRELARRFGADEVVDPAAEDPVRVLRARAPGEVRVVIEAAGRPETVLQAVDVAGYGSTVLLFGVCPESLEVQVRPFAIYRRELRVQGCFVNPFTFERAVKLLEAGRLDVPPLLTHRLALEDLTFALSRDFRGRTVKSVVVF